MDYVDFADLVVNASPHGIEPKPRVCLDVAVT